MSPVDLADTNRVCNSFPAPLQAPVLSDARDDNDESEDWLPKRLASDDKAMTSIDLALPAWVFAKVAACFFSIVLGGQLALSSGSRSDRR